MNKNIVITILALALSGILIWGMINMPKDKEPIKDPEVSEVENEDDKNTQDVEENSDDKEATNDKYDKIEFESNDLVLINEKEDTGVRIRDNEFIIGVPYSDNVQMWHFEPTEEVNVYTMVDIQDRIDNPSPEAINDYVKVEDAFPNGLTFKLITPSSVEVYHGTELIDLFTPLNEEINN